MKKSKKSSFIRISNHSIKYSNNGKIEYLNKFCDAYHEALIHFVDYLWTNDIEWKKNKGETKVLFSIKLGFYECPSMISTVGIEPDTILSARALKCVATQACGIVSAVADKRIKDLKKIEWLKSKNKIVPKTLLNRVSKDLTKPVLDDNKPVSAELNSICVDMEDVKTKTKEFDSFIQLKSIFNKNFLKENNLKRGFSIRIPIKYHRQSRKWESKGVRLNSFLINKQSINIRWEIPQPVLKDLSQSSSGSTIAIDSGKTSCWTSNTGIESTKDKHGHDLSSIINKMSKKRKGSKSFARSQEHRTNHINWSVKQLSIDNINEIKFEDNFDMRRGQSSSRSLGHWTHQEIRSAFKKLSEENGVRFTLVGSEYNSQRCFVCGWVQKSNRKGKMFCCTNIDCHHTNDADINGAQNVSIRDSLFILPFEFRSLRLNIKGFFWKPEGIYFRDGSVFTVPDSAK